MLSHVQLFATPFSVACQAPLSVEFSRQEYGSGQPFPSPGDLPRSSDGTRLSHIADSLPSEPPGKHQKGRGTPNFGTNQQTLTEYPKCPLGGSLSLNASCPPPSPDPWGPGPILARPRHLCRRGSRRASGCPGRISSGLCVTCVGGERNKLPAYGGGQGKVIPIREGSPRSQANPTSCVTPGGRATGGVIYPSRSWSAAPPPPSRISHLFLAFAKKGETARVACCKISHLQGDGGGN